MRPVVHVIAVGPSRSVVILPAAIVAPTAPGGSKISPLAVVGQVIIRLVMIRLLPEVVKDKRKRERNTPADLGLSGPLKRKK
jgi:hypothetical protein